MLPPPGDPRPHNLGDILASLQDENLKPAQLSLDYVQYHGRLYHVHQEMFLNRVRAGLVREGRSDAAELRFSDVFCPDTRLHSAFLQAYAPHAAHAYFADGGALPARRLAVLPPSEGAWTDPDFPAQFRVAGRSAERPGIDLLIVDPAAPLRLFVSRESFQLFDVQADLAWAEAGSRTLGRAIAYCPAVQIDRPVIVAGDQFEATNFSHFLYDHVPRIIRAALALPDLAREALFLIGERAAHPLQSYILHRVCARHGLDMRQMVFPERSEVWRVTRPVVFSTDQRAAHRHPLHQCHPETVAQVRALIDGAALPAETPRRIFLSRRDAPFRRVVNEDELAAVLAPLGYVPVALSGHDAATQIALLAGAERIVAPHGMGLAGLVFNRRRGRLLELFHPAIGTDAYAAVAHAIGIAHAHETGSEADGPGVPYRVAAGALEARLGFLA